MGRDQGTNCEDGMIIVNNILPPKMMDFSDGVIMLNWKNLKQEPKAKPSIIGTTFVNLGEFVSCGEEAKKSTKIFVSCCIGGVTSEAVFCVRLSSFCHFIMFLNFYLTTYYLLKVTIAYIKVSGYKADALVFNLKD